MKNSRDLALVIMFAVLSFVFMLLIGQVPNLITGIAGIGYAFTIAYSITQTVAWLMYEGRRWRISMQGLLLSLLALSFIPAWGLGAALATILNNFIVDVIFSSVYRFFERKNKLFLWVLLSQVYYWATHSFWTLLFAASLLYSFEGLLKNWFIPIMSLMIPVMIIEAIAGSYIGYKIYLRVKKVA